MFGVWNYLTDQTVSTDIASLELKWVRHCLSYTGWWILPVLSRFYMSFLCLPGRLLWRRRLGVWLWWSAWDVFWSSTLLRTREKCLRSNTEKYLSFLPFERLHILWVGHTLATPQFLASRRISNARWKGSKFTLRLSIHALAFHFNLRLCNFFMRWEMQLSKKVILSTIFDRKSLEKSIEHLYNTDSW